MRSILALLLLLSLGGCRGATESPAQPAPPDETTTLLLPVLLGEEPITIAGRSWTTITITDWPGAEVLWVGIGGQPAAIRPGASRPPEFRRNELAGMLLLLPEGAARELKIDHFLRESSSGTTVSLPTPRAYDAEPGSTSLRWVPREGSGATLRVYDLVSTPEAKVTIRMTSGGTTRDLGELPLVQITPSAPHFTELALSDAQAGSETVIEVVPSVPSARLWALLVEASESDGELRIVSSSDGND